MAMNRVRPQYRYQYALRQFVWVIALSAAARAQVCQDAADIDAPIRTAIETTAKRFFDMSARGDVAALRENSIPSVASHFAGIDAAVKENREAFAGANISVRPPYLLTAEGAEPLPRAEFLCGVFGRTGQTKDSAVFVLNNLPPGKYGVAIVDASGDKGAMTLTFILQLTDG